ncbi:hypothetical protein [Paenibacillus macerans]|uniref:hypothetical protein n=1 Tax=Paenibacillus macerans TaxID=44252 RepID=UPI00204087CB|nr:hypothetical protein [Paenibacillus macerans]MCM3700810.1 hypothetical protein [Paenibacillus macerans]
MLLYPGRSRQISSPDAVSRTTLRRGSTAIPMLHFTASFIVSIAPSSITAWNRSPIPAAHTSDRSGIPASVTLKNSRLIGKIPIDWR